ncbi:MAG: hypothetical protein EPN88_14340, partial [Bacteroidetes bacterium]
MELTHSFRQISKKIYCYNFHLQRNNTLRVDLYGYTIYLYIGSFLKKIMTSLERTLAFLKGDQVDRPPFHPFIMRWAAKYAGIKYRDFCLDPFSKCKAMILCAKDFDIDWVVATSDPWVEAS